MENMTWQKSTAQRGATQTVWPFVILEEIDGNIEMVHLS